LSIKGRAADVFAKNISSLRELLQKQLIALAEGRSLDLDSEAFVSEYVNLLQTLDFKDDKIKVTFLLELSLMVMDEEIPLWCRKDWLENLLEAHLQVIYARKNSLFEVMDVLFFKKTPFSFYKLLSNKLNYVKKNFRHVVIKEEAWIYMTINLFHFDESLPEKIRFYYFFDAYLNATIAKTIQSLSRVKFLFFQKAIFSFPQERLTAFSFKMILSLVFKIKKVDCYPSNYLRIIPFFNEVLPILFQKTEEHSFRKDLFKIWFDYWKSSPLTNEIFIRNLKFLPDYFTINFGKFSSNNNIWNRIDSQMSMDILNHLFTGKNIRTYRPVHIYFTKKMAHYFHNFNENYFVCFKDIYRRSIFETLFQHTRLLDLLVEFRFNNRFDLNPFGMNKPTYDQFKNFLLKLDSWGIYDWDRNEIREVLGYINHAYQDIANFTLQGVTAASIQRRASIYYEQIRQRQIAKASYYKWKGAAYKAMSFEMKGNQYQIQQLTNASELLIESNRLSHCVRSYSSKCYAGKVSIWSLRIHKNQQWQSLVTIEVSDQHNIIQAKAKFNATPDNFYMEMIKQWAEREDLRMRI
ncbi:MAG TPA: hypothetical protein ENK75_06985, partial [Saprospiraceae bacterium]|nr:hypothetical protein [Saprospiraceae bacterium]